MIWKESPFANAPVPLIWNVTPSTFKIVLKFCVIRIFDAQLICFIRVVVYIKLKRTSDSNGCRKISTHKWLCGVFHRPPRGSVTKQLPIEIRTSILDGFAFDNRDFEAVTAAIRLREKLRRYESAARENRD